MIWGSHLILLVNIDDESGESYEKEAEIMASKILRSKTYSRPTLKHGEISKIKLEVGVE